MRKEILWTTVVTAHLIFFGYWAGLYVATVIAVCLASVAIVRQKFGLWMAYLTTLPITGVGFYCLIASIGPAPQNVSEGLGELLFCCVFGAIGGAITLGIVCFLLFVVNSLDALLQAKTRN